MPSITLCRIHLILIMSEESLLRIQRLEQENAQLKEEIALLRHQNSSDEISLTSLSTSTLSLEEYRRYGRQMIVPDFGSLAGQLRLKESKILVIGAGGLGCPALLYLSGAGVGTIGILDNDVVDVSNLHRQVLHTTDRVGMLKCESARMYLSLLNPHVNVITHPERLTNENAFFIISQYDLVVDCTDTPATRYLINDVSVLCGKTIVSGSGVKSDGQITVLNFNNEGPCYRCFYPKPPKPESVSTCGDAGVLGPAIGLTGVALAVETIKVLTGYYDGAFKPFLSMYTAYPQQAMRVFKMRNRQSNCASCGDSPVISRASIESNAIDYAAFCGSVNSNVLTEDLRVSPRDFQKIFDQQNVFVVDVRPKEQFGITKLPNSINIAWEYNLANMDSIDKYLPATFDKDVDHVYVVCRYGNDSQLATRKLIDQFGFKHVKDIKGGLNKWSTDVDPTMPIY